MKYVCLVLLIAFIMGQCALILSGRESDKDRSDLERDTDRRADGDGEGH